MLTPRRSARHGVLAGVGNLKHASFPKGKENACNAAVHEKFSTKSVSESMVLNHSTFLFGLPTGMFPTPLQPRHWQTHFPLIARKCDVPAACGRPGVTLQQSNFAGW